MRVLSRGLSPINKSLSKEYWYVRIDDDNIADKRD